MISFDMLAESQSNEDHSYNVIAEDSMHGCLRLIIDCKEDNGEPFNSQGVDLNHQECRALGEYLLSAANRLKKNS